MTLAAVDHVMGFFTDVGRTVERVKRSVTDDPTGYRCSACGELHDADHDHCPDCGEAAVVAMETDGEGETAGAPRETDGEVASDDGED